MYERYKDRAEFVFVAIREAGHRLAGFEFLMEKPALPPEQALLHRRKCLDQAMKLTKLPMKGYFDLPDNAASEAYGAFPGRLLLVNKEGRIARDFGHPFRQHWNWEEFIRVMDEQFVMQAARPNTMAGGPARTPREFGLCLEIGPVLLVQRVASDQNVKTKNGMGVSSAGAKKPRRL
jgi:hypothetical protein